MELTELQKVLIGGLQLLDLPKDNIIMVMLMLKDSEQKQWNMLVWLADKMQNGNMPNQEQVMDKAQEIMNSDK